MTSPFHKDSAFAQDERRQRLVAEARELEAAGFDPDVMRRQPIPDQEREDRERIARESERRAARADLEEVNFLLVEALHALQAGDLDKAISLVEGAQGVVYQNLR